MTANEAFESILNQVQSSCLNFKIELSPFSAVIYLRKSFIKDQNGVTVSPPAEIPTERNVTVKHLEKEKNDLEMKLVKAIHETKAYHEALDDINKNEYGRISSGDMLILKGIGQLSFSNSHLITLFFTYSLVYYLLIN